MSLTARLRGPNLRIARAIDARWPYSGPRAFDEFPEVVSRWVRDERRAQRLVDVGAGADSSFIDVLRKDGRRLHASGVDVEADALAANTALDQRYVADVARERLPFADGSIDCVTSRSVLEHLPDVDALVAESARVLAPGGYSIHLCSCRNAPFAIAGRVLPHRIARRLLFAVLPESVGSQGFRTYYRRCTPKELRETFTSHGFEVVEERISYRSSQYFKSLGPLFLGARLYETLLSKLRIAPLASYVTVVARVPSPRRRNGGRARNGKPRVVYWNYMPAPYMVDRFNALAARGNVEFEAWFNARREPHWSGPWTVDESSWGFHYRYIPHVFVKGRSLGLPPPLLSKRTPSVVISPHGEPSFVAGWNLARARGVRTAFWVVKTFDTWTPRRAYAEHIKRYMFPRTDGIFVPGDDARGYARQYGAREGRIITVEHPIDAEFSRLASRTDSSAGAQLRAELGLTGTTFVYAGRLWWGKGLTYLLDAFEQVQGSGATVSLLLIGDGDERAALEARVHQRGLDNVIFAGFQQKHDLPAYYAASDAFVFPTLGDPFGLVIGEAMTCGLPVISSSAAGEIGSRVVEGRNGFIVPPAESKSLADRMRVLVARPELIKRMGDASRDMAAGHTPERWAAQLEEGIDRVLSLPASA
jgi:glycosyltransferase involved in cell wall biosynthesis/ubiquinone/menaquinone biosynthesis C-methylase UbiE